MLLGSLQIDRLTRRYGNHKLTVIGTGLLSTYPLLTAFMPNLLFYVITSIVGGLAWALAGGTLANYLLEKVPDNDRPAYLAWYNIALNSAIFIGVLLGPLLATIFNVQVRAGAGLYLSPRRVDLHLAGRPRQASRGHCPAPAPIGR